MSEWVVRIEERLRTMGLEPLPTKEEEELPETERFQRGQMYRIPTTHGYMDRDFNDVYKPSKVSIGPWYTWNMGVGLKLSSRLSRYSKGREVKEACLVHLLRRSGKPLESYLTALTEVIDELRDAYGGLDLQGDDTQSFLEMMLLDACFLLEFIYTMRYFKSPSADANSVNPIIMCILENPEEMKCYVRDILLLENQVPLNLILLEKLRMVGNGGWGSVSTEGDRIEFLKVIAATFIPITRVPKIECMYSEFKHSLHILDVYRMSLVHHDFEGENVDKTTPQAKKSQSTNIPTATELHKIGIGFTVSDSTSLLDISFRRKTIKLPAIIVDGSTKSVFLNLIALEKLRKEVDKNEVTSYMYFMGCLVQVIDDARLLQSRGIIVTTLPPFEVTQLFRRMSKNITLGHESLDPECIETLKMVREKFNKLSNEWRKDLFQTYLKSPWAVMSVMAAILLLTLSIIQTVYTVLSYVRPK
ncbi:hypothetical protein ACS0TY_000652 [Phlomoides rotata]